MVTAGLPFTSRTTVGIPFSAGFTDPMARGRNTFLMSKTQICAAGTPVDEVPATSLGTSRAIREPSRTPARAVHKSPFAGIICCAELVPSKAVLVISEMSVPLKTAYSQVTNCPPVIFGPLPSTITVVCNLGLAESIGVWNFTVGIFERSSETVTRSISLPDLNSPQLDFNPSYMLGVQPLSAIAETMISAEASIFFNLKLS